MRLLLSFLLLCGVAAAGEIKVVEGDQTSLDKYFEYSFDGIEKKPTDYLQIHGRLKNTSTKNFNFVAVSITLKNNNGKFLGRNAVLTNPGIIAAGDIGFSSVLIKVDKSDTPAIIEWSVSMATEIP